MRTFRGFETHTDAITFKRFLEATGYKNIDMEYNEFSNKWRVHFEIKD